MISIFVTIQVKPEFINQFKEASFGDSQGAVRDEPGCFRFDILKDDSDPNRIHLYEIYEDQAAIEAHRNAPHYLKWRSTIESMVEGDFQRVSMTTIFPSDEGWRKQKPHLLDW